MWSQQKRLAVIDDLHAATCLWDVHSPEYRNTSIKAEALALLARKYGVDSVEMEKKIQALKSQFRREHKKILDAQREGAPSKRSIWFGYERLLFLLPCYGIRGNRAMYDPEMTDETSHKLLYGDDTDGNIDDDIDNYSSVSGASSGATEAHSKDPLTALEAVENNSLKRKEFVPPLNPQKKQAFDSNDAEAFKCLTTLTESVCKRDALSIYGEHIGNKLRSSGRSSLEVAIAQNEIDNICFKLAMGGFSDLAQSYHQSKQATASVPTPVRLHSSNLNAAKAPPMFTERFDPF